eukprot:4706236-Pyramimonas_sp.AAC.1
MLCQGAGTRSVSELNELRFSPPPLRCNAERVTECVAEERAAVFCAPQLPPRARHRSAGGVAQVQHGGPACGAGDPQGAR